MRKFLPVPADTTCQVCKEAVAASPAEGYSRQTVVTFDGSTVSATYCSNKCVNEDAQRLADEAFPVDAALREVRRTKAPTKRAALVARYVLELRTQDQVNEFTAQLRREAGAQDAQLLPTCTWTVRETSAPHGTGTLTPTNVLLNTLADAEAVRISWPSVTFHWGVMVTFTWGDKFYVAHSDDYQVTETYLSS